MFDHVILASGSAIRASLLKNAGVEFKVMVPRLDEDAIRQSMTAEGVSARDQADALAEHKARKIGMKAMDALVIGCDQVLEINGVCLAKAKDKDEAAQQLRTLSGQTHTLHSAAVVWHDASPVWRHVGRVRLHMRELSEEYVDAYLERNWESVRHAVGCYKLEEEGVRLFSSIEGDYFTVLGLPLVELLGYLTVRGVLEG